MADPIILRFQAEGLDSFSQELVQSSKNLDALNKGVDESVSGINEMNAAIAKSKEVLSGLKPGTDEFNRLNKEIQAAEIVSKSFTQETATLKTQLRETIVQVQNMSLQLEEMRKNGLQGTSAYKALSKEFDSAKNKAGQLKDRIGDLNKETAQLGSDTKNIDKFIRTLNVGISAVSGIQAASALWGEESENLQRTLVKLNAAMALSNSLQQIGEELSKADSVFSIAAAKAKGLWTAATTALTEATVGLRIALSALGLGAIIAVVYAVVRAFKEYTTATEKLAEAKIKLKKESDKQLGNLDTELKYLQAIGKSNKEIVKYEITQKKAALKVTEDALRAQTKAVQELMEKRNEEVFGFKTVTKKRLEEENDKLKELLLSYKEQTFAVFEAEQKLKSFGEKGSEAIDKISQSQRKVNMRDFLKMLGIGGGTGIDPFQAAGGRVFRSIQDNAFAAAQQRNQVLQKLDAELEARRNKALNDRLNAEKRVQDEIVSREQFATEQKKSFVQSLENAISGFAATAVQAAGVRAEKETQALNDKKQKGLISERLYQKELNKIKNEQAIKEKKAAVAEAFLKIPLIVLNALTSVPFPANIAAAALMGSLALAQAAILAARPVPKFRHGGDVGEVFRGSGFVRGRSHEKGGVNAELEGNEFVQRGKAVKHYGVEFMKNVNSLKFPKALTVSQKVKPVYNTVNNTMLGTELQFIGQYIKQGNDATIQSNRLIQHLIEVSKTKNRNA